MDNQRIYIWAGVALVAYMNYALYQRDYAPPSPPAAVPAATAPAPATGPNLGVPRPATEAPAGVAPAAAPAAAPVTAAPEPALTRTVHVRTDVLDLDITLPGGAITRADLLAYPLTKAAPDVKVRLFDPTPEHRYSFRSGLSGALASAKSAEIADYSTAKDSYQLADGADTLEVPLTATDGPVTVTKTFVLHRGHYAIDLGYAIRNDGTEPFTAFDYGQLARVHEPTKRSMFNPETYAYRGPALYDGSKYARIDVDPPKPDEMPANPVAAGWAATMQHHFVAVYVPDAKTPYRYSFEMKDGTYAFGAAGPSVVVAPGTTGEIHSKVYVGPKLTHELELVAPTLTYAIDYGKYLTPLAKPLFWVLNYAHKLVNNWGVAIVLATLLIKLVFYKLAETSGRSMARMRTIQPKMKELQERYKDNREELGKQMMELYKREKINPVAGCLPMVVQIPVFFAFYQVLLESVEMRHAPFMLWIQDLTSKDPYYVLPMLMGATMLVQFRMNPASPDPMQQKVMMFMPIVMTATMMFLPSGLVVYMITNMALSILQQWHINKVVAREGKKRRT